MKRSSPSRRVVAVCTTFAVFAAIGAAVTVVADCTSTADRCFYHDSCGFAPTCNGGPQGFKKMTKDHGENKCEDMPEMFHKCSRDEFNPVLCSEGDLFAADPQCKLGFIATWQFKIATVCSDATNCD